MVKLVKAGFEDCDLLHDLQIQSFKALLDKYSDYDTNPGAETLQTVQRKMKDSKYYLIKNKDNIVVGAVRVIILENSARISPIFILPKYQNLGYAGCAINSLEKLYSDINLWRIETIKEETKLCSFYYNLGFRPTGRQEVLHKNMTIVYYEKRL